MGTYIIFSLLTELSVIYKRLNFKCTYQSLKKRDISSEFGISRFICNVYLGVECNIPVYLILM